MAELSKTDRAELIAELVDDLNTWDERSVMGWAQQVRGEQLNLLSDDDLIEDYAGSTGEEVCNDCGHVPQTGACFHCKMD
jgi:hypothetical protein